MASDGGEKPEGFGVEQVAVTTRSYDWIIPILRLLAFFATLAATLVMALNKQKKTFVVATIGTTPIQVTLTAKFQHTPAFVFFVIANGNASLHNLLMLIVSILGPKFDYKGFRPLVIAALDMMNVALVSGGVNAAAFMGQLGRDGNSHARWNKICDKFDSYCDRGSGAMLASFIGLGLMIIINIISIVKLRSHKLVNSSISP
ncbi:CASP 1B2 [Olea europaea subsp. europaea]|uniref:CASP-like protein n=1 Tax=Olea europaea subsp. europaea TaxID=158383 RepID=A0A8S0R0U6_OLEEU|nr:CASP 1B2 [Olea europaea subsp. europaea]